MSKPDTNQASELFELCKDVYKRLPMWDNTEKCYAYLKNPYFDVWDWQVIPLHEDNIDDVDEWHPLYTSDYLLEKLPHYLEYWAGGNEAGYLTVIKGARDYRAGYFAQNVEPYIAFESEWTSTPLKALLKLTIALSEAGELK